MLSDLRELAVLAGDEDGTVRLPDVAGLAFDMDSEFGPSAVLQCLRSTGGLPAGLSARSLPDRDQDVEEGERWPPPVGTRPLHTDERESAMRRTASRFCPRMPGVCYAGMAALVAEAGPPLRQRLSRHLSDHASLASFVHRAQLTNLLQSPPRCGLAVLAAATAANESAPRAAGADSDGTEDVAALEQSTSKAAWSSGLDGIGPALCAVLTAEAPDDVMAAVPVLLPEQKWWYWESQAAGHLDVPFLPAESQSIDAIISRNARSAMVPCSEGLERMPDGDVTKLAQAVGVYGSSPAEQRASLAKYRSDLDSWVPPIGVDQVLERMPLRALLRLAFKRGATGLEAAAGTKPEERRKLCLQKLREIRSGDSEEASITFVDTDGDTNVFSLQGSKLTYSPRTGHPLPVEDIRYVAGDRRLMAAEWAMTFRDYGLSLDMLLTQLHELAAAACVPCNIAGSAAGEIIHRDSLHYCGRRLKCVGGESWSRACKGVSPDVMQLVLKRAQHSDPRAFCSALLTRPLPEVLRMYPKAAWLLRDAAEEGSVLSECWVAGDAARLRPLVEELSRRDAWDAAKGPDAQTGDASECTVSQDEGKMLKVDAGTIDELLAARFGSAEAGWEEVPLDRLRSAPAHVIHPLAAETFGVLPMRIADLGVAELRRGGLRVFVDGGSLVPQQPKEWACQACTYLNDATVSRCEICSGARTRPKPTARSGPQRRLEITFRPRRLHIDRLLQPRGTWCAEGFGGWLPFTNRESAAITDAYRRGDPVAVLPPVSAATLLTRLGERTVDLAEMRSSDGNRVTFFEGLGFEEAAARLTLAQMGLLSQRVAVAAASGWDSVFRRMGSVPLAGALRLFPLLASAYAAASPDTRERLVKHWSDSQSSVPQCLARRGMFCGTVGTGLQLLARASKCDQPVDPQAPVRGAVLLSLAAAASMKPVCPQIHALKRFECDKDTYRCDHCNHAVPRGSIAHGCRGCDYDLCESCFPKGPWPSEDLNFALPPPGYWAVERQKGKWVPVTPQDADRLDAARLRGDYHSNVGSVDSIDFVRMRCAAGRLKREALPEGQSYEDLLMNVSVEIVRLYVEQIREFSPNDFTLLSRLSEDDVPKTASDDQKARVVHEEATGQEGTCMICLDDVTEGQPVGKMPCKHYFHTDCLDEHLQRSRCCPCCKAEL